MNTLHHLESSFQGFIEELLDYPLEFLINSNREVLESFELYKHLLPEANGIENEMSFEVLKKGQHTALQNAKYAVWISPRYYNGLQLYFTLIAVKEGTQLVLEQVFVTQASPIEARLAR